MGPLQFGQARDIVVPMKIPAGQAPHLEVIVSYPRNGAAHKVSHISGNRIANQEAIVAGLRSKAVTVGYECLILSEIGEGEQAQTKMKFMADEIAAIAELAPDCAALVELSFDVGGRMSKALDGADRFNRWGKHYLRCIVRSH